MSLAPELVGGLEPSRTRAGTLTPSGVRLFEAARVRELVEGRLGDAGVTRVANITGFDRIGVPVHSAIRPQGRVLSSASGKGLDGVSSWISAAMEAIEHAAWESTAPARLVASEDELRRRSEPFVLGDRFPARTGALWNSSIPIRWRWATSIDLDSEFLVPDSLVSPRSGGLSPFSDGSNGLASGASPDEATLSALLELIERDALTLNRVRNFAVEVDAQQAIEDASSQLWAALANASVLVRLFDATTEFGVPVSLCRISDAPGEPVGRCAGAGAALSGRAAVVRAVTEAIQSRALLIAGARDDIFGHQRRALLRSRAEPPAPTRQPVAREHSTGTVSGDLNEVANRLRVGGVGPVLRVELDSPLECVSVVRVLVPDLEGYPFESSRPGARARSWVPTTTRGNL